MNYGNNTINNLSASAVKNRKMFIGGAIAFVVILLIGVIVFNGDKSPVTKSNNPYGMRFNKTIEEFCEDYNVALEYIFNQSGESYNGAISLSPSNFTYSQTLDGNIKQYNCNYSNDCSISLFVESDTNYIANACVGYSQSNNNALILSARVVYPAIIISLTNCSYDEATDVIKNVTSNVKNNTGRFFENNVLYYMGTNSDNITYMYVNASDKNRYE